MLAALLAALPTVFALAAARRQRLLPRYLACLAAALVCGAGLAVLCALLLARATHCADDGGLSGLLGGVVGFGLGWVAGAVIGPAVLLHLRGAELDATRLCLATVNGFSITLVLLALTQTLPDQRSASFGWVLLLAVVSSSATFAAFTLASSAPPPRPPLATARFR